MKLTNLLKVNFSVLICILIIKSAGFPQIKDFDIIELEKKIFENGLVDIRDLDSTIQVDLKYSGKNNFMGEDVYGELNSCFLQKAAAEKLIKANMTLKTRNPDLSLLVVDGLRPGRIQWKMWNIVKNTPMQKYVANPAYGSMHNYGCAVDLTIVDSHGNRLDMGTPMDHFGELAQPVLETKFLKMGRISASQVANRHLLRDVMIAAGFYPITIEWWHFEAFKNSYIRNTYKLIE